MARYFDVHPQDPQPRSITQVAALLRDDALIAYPTDSCYALGCRLDNPTGAERIRHIRSLDDGHHFTLVCHGSVEERSRASWKNVLLKVYKKSFSLFRLILTAKTLLGMSKHYFLLLWMLQVLRFRCLGVVSRQVVSLNTLTQRQ